MVFSNGSTFNHNHNEQHDLLNFATDSLLTVMSPMTESCSLLSETGFHYCQLSKRSSLDRYDLQCDGKCDGKSCESSSSDYYLKDGGNSGRESIS